MEQGRKPKRDAWSWYTLFLLPSPEEHMVSVDLSPIWIRHLAWSKRDGKELRTIVTQRYASNMVFMSLLLSTGLGVLFSPSDVTTELRRNLRTKDDMLQFALGLILFLSIICAILALVSTFTVWAVLSSISDANAQIVIRSSVGLAAAQLPPRIICVTIVMFLTWVLLWLFVLLPPDMKWLSTTIAVVTAFTYWYINMLNSALGRMVIYTSAMGAEPVFDVQQAESQDMHALQASLAKLAKEEKRKDISVMQQYRKAPKKDVEESAENPSSS